MLIHIIPKYLRVMYKTSAFFQAEAPETGDNLDNFPKLRSFNSKEIANLMCFPSNFGMQLYIKTVLTLFHF